MALSWLLNIARTLLVDNSSTPNDGSTGFNREIKSGWTDELKKEGGDGDEMEKFVNGGFQMPLHYPRYVKSDYEKMEEWQLDLLLREYGLNFSGSLDERRKFAMGAFLWPDQF